MDDAATTFATVCAVMAASTGMVLCFAHKDTKSAVLEEEPVMIEEKTVAEELPINEDPVVEDSTTPAPDVVTEEPAVVEPVNDEAAATTTDVANSELPEQRPDDLAVSKKTKSKRWNRIVERPPKRMKNEKTRTWLWRSKKTVTKGQEV
jgi:hypothetical protein